MPIPFNADEIFDIAIQIERNGSKFYRTSAQYTKDANAKKLFLELAAMEDVHEATFIQMKEQGATATWSKELYDPNSESSAYLQALAGGFVFNMYDDPFMQLKGTESIVEVLKAAIKREKESVVFFHGMKDLVPKNLGAEKIESIIKEEMSHIVLLSRKLKEVEA
jgi:rubrerythrin